MNTYSSPENRMTPDEASLLQEICAFCEENGLSCTHSGSVIGFGLGFVGDFCLFWIGEAEGEFRFYARLEARAEGKQPPADCPFSPDRRSVIFYAIKTSLAKAREIKAQEVPNIFITDEMTESAPTDSEETSASHPDIPTKKEALLYVNDSLFTATEQLDCALHLFEKYLAETDNDHRLPASLGRRTLRILAHLNIRTDGELCVCGAAKLACFPGCGKATLTALTKYIQERTGAKPADFASYRRTAVPLFVFKKVRTLPPDEGAHLAALGAHLTDLVGVCLTRWTALRPNSRNAVILKKYCEDDSLTLTELGEELDLTRERVRQLVAREQRQLHYIFRYRETDGQLGAALDGMREIFDRQLADLITFAHYGSRGAQRKFYTGVCIFYGRDTAESLKKLAFSGKDEKKKRPHARVLAVQKMLEGAFLQARTEIAPYLPFARLESGEQISPDLLIEKADGGIVAVLVRPLADMALSENLKIYNLFHRFCGERNMTYMILDEYGHSVYDLRRKSPNPVLAARMDSLLAAKGEITEADLCELGIDSENLTLYVLQNRLDYFAAPRRIKKRENDG